MTAVSTAANGSHQGRGGWVEALFFTLALSVLNVAYGLGQQLGVHPIALIFYAMPIAALALLLISGMGDDWRAVMAHPLSLTVGGGIIVMEAVYYVLLGYVTPTDGSVLVRLGVPISIVLGYLWAGRRPTRIAILGGVVIVATILWYVPQMVSAAPLTGLALGAACGFIMSARSFAAEIHPWNRQAHGVLEKMRVTGLMLLLASVVGSAVLLSAMAAASHGLFVAPAWFPEVHHLLHPPAMWLGFFVGALVLTAMQYLGFSVVVKLGAERFVATTALIPAGTLAVQQAAMWAGILTPLPVDWRVMPAILGIIAGVALVIAGNHRRG